jgi:hypothetical protein
MVILVTVSLLDFSKMEPKFELLDSTFQAVCLFTIAPPHFPQIKINCKNLICDNQALYAYGTHEKEL